MVKSEREYRPGHRMPDIADEALSSGILRALLRHWRSLQADKEMPRRSTFDPMKIPTILPNVFLLGLEEESGRFRIRVIGTRLGSLLGPELTGLHVDAAPLPPQMRETLLEQAAAAVPFIVRGRAELNEKVTAGYELLGLPLARDDGSHGFTLGGIDFDHPRFGRRDPRAEQG